MVILRGYCLKFVKFEQLKLRINYHTKIYGKLWCSSEAQIYALFVINSKESTLISDLFTVSSPIRIQIPSIFVVKAKGSQIGKTLCKKVNNEARKNIFVGLNYSLSHFLLYFSVRPNEENGCINSACWQNYNDCVYCERLAYLVR